LLEDGDHINGGSLSLLESIGVELVSLGEVNNSLSNVALGRELGDIWAALRLDSTLDGSGNLLMVIVLDKSFHLIISEKIDWVSSESNLITLLEGWLEGLDNKSNLESSIGCEDISGVNLVHLERPLSNEDNL
jgi:hypothetical protein